MSSYQAKQLQCLGESWMYFSLSLSLLSPPLSSISFNTVGMHDLLYAKLPLVGRLFPPFSFLLTNKCIFWEEISSELPDNSQSTAVVSLSRMIGRQIYLSSESFSFTYAALFRQMLLPPHFFAGIKANITFIDCWDFELGRKQGCKVRLLLKNYV